MGDPVETLPGSTRRRDPGFERVRPVADAVLYEGYLLYPYRRSSPKNRVRWQFGIVAPRAWVEAAGPITPGVAGSAESWRQQTECLLEAEELAADDPDPAVHVRVRYLQLQHRRVERSGADGRHVPVESLEAAGTVHLPFDEAVPRETDIVVPLADLLAGERTFQVGAPGGEETEELPGGAGRFVRRRHPVEATTTLRAEPLEPSRALYRLHVRSENTARAVGLSAPREEALRHALIATHTFIGGSGLAFVSLTDPPAWAEPYARNCRNLHTYPVLAGDPPDRDLVLSSPIILSDHPQIAPESPGDLHDAAEIDEILSLRTLLLTDEEKREARSTDARAAQILDRVDGMPPEVFARLHGTIRSLAPASDGVNADGGDAGSAEVGGVTVARGSRVRLRPRGRGADAQDMFLAGRTARVAAVHHDVDGTVYLAVTLDDDPAAELHSWYGHFRYFRTDEVQPLAATADDPEEEGSDGRRPALGT